MRGRRGRCVLLLALGLLLALSACTWHRGGNLVILNDSNRTVGCVSVIYASSDPDDRRRDTARLRNSQSDRLWMDTEKELTFRIEVYAEDGCTLLLSETLTARFQGEEARVVELYDRRGGGMGAVVLQTNRPGGA